MAFSTNDTIVAVATPPGRGGIGVVRLSGPDARSVAHRLITRPSPLQPRHATLTRIRRTVPPLPAMQHTPQPTSPASSAIDRVVATFFPAPASYTGEDVVELSAHGSPVVLGAIVSEAIQAGARLAEPGEFTLRAFLNGRIDLLQAEAVADLIDAVTPIQARAAFDQLEGTSTRAIAAIDAALFDLIARLEASVDFPEEGYHFVQPETLASAIDDLIDRTAALVADARRGRMIREGFQVAIVGRPNVGKSSLFNALAGAARAIVTSVPGTTRDLVTELVDVEGLPVTLVDTAGLRETNDPVEIEGVDRTRRALSVVDLVLVVLDQSEPLTESDEHILLQTSDYKRLVVINKTDLPSRRGQRSLPSPGFAVSSTTGDGVAELKRQIGAALDAESFRDRPATANVRHIALLENAHEALSRARTAALADGQSLSEEFVLVDLQSARAAFEEVSGRRVPDDLLAEIFSRFCIGK
ncbi:MAG: tRNA uridine-5-carboxymethylaminomethyl(34) synthesis GTPase MnmE [Acidobacteriia bacterium]|nr:tRNA uridine-5-carboxymethylaminomethyl(34) synthesis GTPase MnmE [Terriglobia bacterium]